jgi:hypothetical protein
MGQPRSASGSTDRGAVAICVNLPPNRCWPTATATTPPGSGSRGGFPSGEPLWRANCPVGNAKHADPAPVSVVRPLFPRPLFPCASCSGPSGGGRKHDQGRRHHISDLTGDQSVVRQVRGQEHHVEQFCGCSQWTSTCSRICHYVSREQSLAVLTSKALRTRAVLPGVWNTTAGQHLLTEPLHQSNPPLVSSLLSHGHQA